MLNRKNKRKKIMKKNTVIFYNRIKKIVKNKKG